MSATMVPQRRGARLRRFGRLWLTAGMAACMPISAASAQATAPPAAAAAGIPVVTLDAGAAGPVIQRDLFGQFAEMLGEGIYGGIWVGRDSRIPNVRGIRSDVVAALRELHVPNVRWPGGCFADQYHWRDGVGPAPARKPRVNVGWGGVIEPSTFGTHEYFDFLQQIGSEAYLSVNVGSGTVQEASDWLEYMTAAQPTALQKERVANGQRQPWRIRLLGIGNEPWGCGGAFAPAAYVDRMKQYLLFVHNMNPDQASSPLQANPNATLRVAAGQGIGDTAYTEAIMHAWHDRQPYLWGIEALSLHYYTTIAGIPMTDPATGFGEPDYARLLRSAYRLDAMIVEHAAIMDRYDPEKRVALAIDEWGAWLRPEPGRNMMFLRQQNSLRDAIIAAVSLNIFARHADRVRMVNIAQMINVIQAMILTENERMILTPTYHVFRMYVPFQGARSLPLSIDAGTYRFQDITLPRLDAIAARATDGTVWIAATNLDPHREAMVGVRVSGVAAGSAAGQVLTAPDVSSVNTFDAATNVAPRPVTFTAAGGALQLRLAPHSVTVVQVRP